MWNVRVSALITNKNKVLMVNHKKGNLSYWLLPGGKLELGEKCEAAIKRELSEELNADIIVGEMAFVVENIGKDRHFIQVTFHCKLPKPERIKLGIDNRVAGFRFLTISELNKLPIYPDIKSELIFFLQNGEFQKRYFYKKWVS